MTLPIMMSSVLLDAKSLCMLQKCGINTVSNNYIVVSLLSFKAHSGRNPASHVFRSSQKSGAASSEFTQADQRLLSLEEVLHPHHDDCTFSVSAERGFLPMKDPLTALTTSSTSTCFAWEETVHDLPKLLATYDTQALRRRIESLPRLGSEMINVMREEEAWRMMSVISFLTQAYVWGSLLSSSSPPATPTGLPPVLAVPFSLLARRLDVPPIISYATYVLLNWRRLDPNQPLRLGNVVSLNNFYGGIDEEWFLLVHLILEANAGPAITATLRAQCAASLQDSHKVGECLEEVARSLEMMQKSMERMEEKCDPEVYYKRIRIFLSGWRNSEQMPEGLVYEGVEEEKPKLLYGASGAQSSIIPLLDAFLGIGHQPGPLLNYMQDIRMYMPKPHRQLLEAIRTGPSIREFAKCHLEQLGGSYDKCVCKLLSFRSVHMDLAKAFIVCPTNRSHPQRTTLSMKGTGGTNTMPYLLQNKITTRTHLLGHSNET